MNKFIAILLATGLLKKPKFTDYWSKNEILQTPGISRIMSRDRFLKIKKYLRFYDINDENYGANDRMKNIRPMM